MKARKTFHISRKPVISLAGDEESHAFSNDLELPRFNGPPRLVAIARDPWTIFAYWNVNWPPIFKNAAPVDRQVHLRVHCADGLAEKEVAVEPMAGMHYVTMSQRHRACRMEIGYYQPADIWHSVVMSNEIMIPAAETSEAEHVDLATIPFHLRFQQLVDLFGAANDDALATVISRFQTRAVSGGKHERLSSEERKILQRTGIAQSQLADARRAFKQIDREKLKRRAEALLRLDSTSPSRAFDWTSAGS
ncbi:MAG: hypothetical protein AUI00_03050 [Verrucomicrobia bacterium 13_2_20CM_2_54_15]|nr:MAG: hypothetical protein AUI00_03050 [Verrucomicrobia bacterium 13_2_20CM_2_54_15]